MEEQAHDPLDARLDPEVSRDEYEDIDSDDGKCFAPYLAQRCEWLRMDRFIGWEAESEEVGMQHKDEQHSQDAE